MKRKVNNWKNMIRFWLSQWDGPVLIVKYEHLKENSLSVIKRILEFIGHGVNEVELERRLHNGYRFVCFSNQVLQLFLPSFVSVF